MSAYLTDAEETRRRIALIERLARDGLKPGESVSPRIAAQIEAVRAGKLEFLKTEFPPDDRRSVTGN